MKPLLQILCVALMLCACKPNNHGLNDYESDALKITQISNTVFLHTSFLKTKSFGTVPSNGMVYVNGNEAIIFDTPVDNDASNELIDWLGNKTIKAVVVTHFHVDCLGGLNAFHSKGITSYATHETIKLAKEDNRKILPQNGFENAYEFQIGHEVVLAKYFGQGHTKDNIVAYVPSEKVLFGGCLIKALNAPKGNLADANPADWPHTVKSLQSELPDIEVVIPGHGKYGDTKLLDYTVDLFEEKERILFFLHNRFLETHNLSEAHPDFGQVEYTEILEAFKHSGLKVISEKRNGNVNAREYAQGIVHKIDSLIQNGTQPSKITVVGTSKGGYIAQYVSTLANNPELNFVFVASFQNSDIQNIPDINYCGNILTVFEKSDPYGVSAVKRKQQSTCQIQNFKEVELNTGMGHGFLFKPLNEWMEPTIQWAKENYTLK